MIDRPRQLAADILRLPEQDRPAAIAAIKTDALRSTVTFYVEEHARRISGVAAWVSLGETKAERNRRLEQVPEGVREEVRRVVIERFEKRKAK